ncbi:hypothetical protein HPP92_021615 [Vanilla planifolia]|uniref:Uncharacterized protein n=1 Tax=Vanilla planifolia TaxID=51239 RepID=A0A835UH98_VANPL|nr:hypothetical protein HPP92_021615 [Vanilla planifolia]
MIKTTFSCINTAGQDSLFSNSGGCGRHGGCYLGHGSSQGHCQICLILGHYAHACYKHLINTLLEIQHIGSYHSPSLTSLVPSFSPLMQVTSTMFHNIPQKPLRLYMVYHDFEPSHHSILDFNLFNNPTSYSSF